MRVAFLAWRDLAHPLAGGSEVAIDRLASGLVARGHEVALLCGGPVGERSYPTVDLGGTYTQYLRAPAAARRLRHWDLLVDVENGVPFWSPLWRRMPSVCLMHHVHTDQWRDRFAWPASAVGRFLERRAVPLVYRRRLFIAVSESTAVGLRALGVDDARIRPLTWGTDPPGGEPVARTREPQFVALGRLVPHKRVDVLLRAWARARPHVGGRLVIAGDGPERAVLAATAGEGVAFVGPVADAEKWRLLRESWALVHAARHEGWGVVVLEAASVGTPALAFDVPGIRDSVVDGHTGLLAASEDQLVDHWIRVAKDGRLRARMGEAARRRALAFTWDATIDQFLAIAREATGLHATVPAAPAGDLTGVA